MQLPRETKQAAIGTQIDKDELLPGDWSFQTGLTKWFACRYLRYQQPIYPRLTSKGVMRSSLDNVYWQKNFWQARRI
ncbi:MAG: NlpC/P60 family protein [Escherichia coli]